MLRGVTGNITKSDDLVLGTHVKVYRRFEDVLADPNVHLVDICTPTPLHADQAIAALKAGKHVLCEKPLARTSADARRILQVAENSPGLLMPAMCMRFWPEWGWLKEVVAEKTYGKVLAARFRRVSEMPTWSTQGTYSGGNDLGGALFDLHIHDSDFVAYLFGKPESVFSTGVTGPGGAINHVVTQYNFPGGPAVFAEGSWLLAKGFNMAYTLHCEHATLDYDMARDGGALMVTGAGQSPRGRAPGTDGYAGEIDYVIDCIINCRRPEIVTARDGVTALEICEAEEKSVHTGLLTKL